MRRFFGHDIALVLATGAFLFSMGLALVLLPKPEFSETENRSLATLSPPTLQNISDGSFSKELSDFYSDRLPARNSFVALKAVSELALGKGENNGIIFGKDGYLIPSCEYSESQFQRAEKNFSYISRLQTEAEGKNIPFLCALAPRSIDVMASALPAAYRGNEGKIWDTADACLSSYADLRPALMQKENIWYRTDHHWTTKGAYVAYCEIGKYMGYTPMTEDFFDIERVSEKFLGTSYSKAGGIFGREDTVELYRYNGDGDFTLKIWETGEEKKGFYYMEALENKDKYSVFLGGNYSKMTVSKETYGERETLLLIKDSYANSMIPFLAIHYDLCVVDPRYYEGNISDLMRDADKVLVLCGMDTVATTPLW